MVDEGRAARLLRGVAERVDRLAHSSEHRITDSESLWLDGVKYLCEQTASAERTSRFWWSTERCHTPRVQRDRRTTNQE
jgi:hypothetical protein